MNYKKIITFILSFTMCGIVIPMDYFPKLNDNSINISADDEIIYTGICGNDVSYSFSNTTGILTINGDGDIWGVLFYEHFSNDIKSVIIEDGVKSIGSDTFSYCSSIEEILIPDSVTSIDDSAFNGCDNMTIKCYGNSTAKKFAQDNGISFTELEYGQIFSASLTLQNNITVNYYAKFIDSISPTDVKMEFEMNDKSTIVEGVLQEDGRYKFAFTKINPDHMCDNITATLTYKVEENEYSTVKESYSIKEYCMYQLNNSSNDKLKKLIVDTLLYGSEVQKYTHYNIDNLASSDLSVEQLSLASSPTLPSDAIEQSSILTGEDSDDFKWLSASLYLSSSITLRYYFQATSIDNLVITTSIKDFYSDDFKYDSANERYYIEFNTISASSFGSIISANFVVNEQIVGKTINYNINTYIKNKYDSLEIGDLVKRMYCYGNSASEYMSAQN